MSRPTESPLGTELDPGPDAELDTDWIRAFETEYGRSPEIGARAPGRVNLIGEHTDYSEGLVLPFAIDRDAVVLAARRTDRLFRVRARDLDARDGFEAATPVRRGDWLDYFQAPVWALRERGVHSVGLDLWVTSAVPLESGLSSSAALCVAVTAALDAANRLSLGPEDWARIAHLGENRFVGVGCGILDHFASALGRRDTALRIDCRTESVEAVPFPGDRLRVLVAHSGVRRKLASGGYGDRVAECELAFEAARRAGIAADSATTLRDLDVSQLPELACALDPVPLRRARHVITENARVDAFRDALRTARFADAGELLRAGQRSLRDDFEVSVPELDALCEIGDALPGVFGSRLTGAGFGGCTLHLVERDRAAEVADALKRAFSQRFDRVPPVWALAPSDGAATLALR